MRIIVFFSLIFVLQNNAVAQTSQADFAFAAPDSLGKLTSLKLWSTQYYIHRFSSGGNIPIVYANGNASGLYADTCDFCDAALEGTAYVTDSTGQVTVINFAAVGDSTYVNCRKCKKYAASKLAVENWGKTRWAQSAGYGDGVKNYKLLPYRTIAVDKTKIPYGTVIYIPKAKGKIIELPNGTKVTHDGYFFAGDTGGAIKKNHIDLFTGIYEGNPFPEVIRSNEKKTFDAFIVTDQVVIRSLTAAQTK
jgi:3D (Asp-Asp-Asp) domain-containing protein